MPLITSISGLRGTIGGRPGDNLTPTDILKFTAAYGVFISRQPADVPAAPARVKIIVGRDGRISGDMVKNLVVGALLSLGLDVVDLGLAATPTVEMAVIQEKAQGGIIITASHNPQGWNALKLLDAQGEFLPAAAVEQVIKLSEQSGAAAGAEFAAEDRLGSYVFNPFLVENHLNAILAMPLVRKDSIARKDFQIVVDGINSVGGLVVPELLKALGVSSVTEINCEPNGRFAHRPEPLAENLAAVMAKVKEVKADLGVVVDPDVDRLAFIDERGEMFGEEYTLVAVADYVLANFAALDAAAPHRYALAAVSNLSSSRALRDIAAKHGAAYAASAVGEVNVVAAMRDSRAVIGGEGNGGVIYPPLHYGRDALAGLALFLSALAVTNQTASEFRKNFPAYSMVKDKIELPAGLDLSSLLAKMKDEYSGGTVGSAGASQPLITTIDGLKIDWSDSWVHLRASNTEPIIRIYGEAATRAAAEAKTEEIKAKILAYIK